MLIRTHDPSAPLPSEITGETVYRARRRFMGQVAGLLALGAGLPGCGEAGQARQVGKAGHGLGPKLAALRPGPYGTDEPKTPFEDVTTYNNFYELGFDKEDPARLAHRLPTDPWSVEISGAVEKPGRYTLEDILGPHALEERVYRLRCVEAWSMVVPWVGFPLGDLLRRFRPTSAAKYVQFTTLYDPENLPGQKQRLSSIEYPYVEGLRIDEAVHPLTILAVGLYGQEMPKQNGAPIRLVVPWKYGFKSIKSIVKIHLAELQPPTTWNKSAPHEYGFYANVNPEVDHPRWSQKNERRLPSTLWTPNKIPTRKFNGYEEQVAGLYRNMNLRTFF